MAQRLALALSTTVLVAVGVLLPAPAYAQDHDWPVGNGGERDLRGTSWEFIDPTLDRRGTSWERILDVS